MVQRNGSKKPLRTPQQQESRAKSGGRRGSETKEKRLMSIEITDFDLDDHVRLSHHPIRTENSSRFPNYMKPTTSSDAKKGTTPRSSDAEKKPVEVTKLHLASSAPRPARIIKRKPSLRAIEISIEPTCSSTLKDSRFPKALDLNHGGTEAEGTSAVKVCPYKYCSLNGHCHEPLPLLKCFLSSRRKLIKAQRSLKLKGLPSFRKDGSRRAKKQITPLIEETAGDFFVEIYTKPENQITPNQAEDVGTCLKDWDGFSRDDNSIDEFEITLNCLEYVNCDRQDESEKKKAPKEFEDAISSECFAANGSVKHDDPPADVSLEEYDEKGSCSVNSYDDFCQSIGDLTKNTNSDGESYVEPEVIQLVFGLTEIAGESSEYQNVTAIVSLGVDCSKRDELAPSAGGDSREKKIFCNSSLGNIKQVEEIKNTEGEETGSMEADEHIKENDADQICTEDVEGSGQGIRPLNTLSKQDLAEVDCLQKLKLSFTRNTKTEELEQMKDFNPRGPNFLPLEPDPEAEKVDLRHQMMDERRNAEEWMIDFALRQTLTKLAAARRKKVALLVEAFETVKPASIHEKP